jgi:hypothetical protein
MERAPSVTRRFPTSRSAWGRGAGAEMSREREGGWAGGEGRLFGSSTLRGRD